MAKMEDQEDFVALLKTHFGDSSARYEALLAKFDQRYQVAKEDPQEIWKNFSEGFSGTLNRLLADWQSLHMDVQAIQEQLASMTKQARGKFFPEFEAYIKQTPAALPDKVENPAGAIQMLKGTLEKLGALENLYLSQAGLTQLEGMKNGFDQARTEWSKCYPIVSPTVKKRKAEQLDEDRILRIIEGIKSRRRLLELKENVQQYLVQDWVPRGQILLDQVTAFGKEFQTLLVMEQSLNANYGSESAIYKNFGTKGKTLLSQVEDGLALLQETEDSEERTKVTAKMTLIQKCVQEMSDILASQGRNAPVDGLVSSVHRLFLITENIIMDCNLKRTQPAIAFTIKG